MRDYKIHEDGSVSIYLDESLCISDGTHAAAALQNFGTAKAYAKMQIVKGLSDTDLVDVADALNMSKRIKLFNLENKRGKFDWICGFNRSFNRPTSALPAGN